MIPRICIILAVILLYGCSGHTPDGRLDRIAGIVSDSPEEALAALDSISRDSLSEADRHFHDLLTIKARDKAYITHTSDSLILDVIDYESRHRENGRLAEALYYGGRVYSDLGDYPTALQYFHKALDNVQKDKSDIGLKASITSQTGRLLDQLGLYDEAIPYIKESINIDEVQKDTVNMVYDLQLLGNTYLRAYKYDLAEHYYNKAIELSHNLPDSFDAISRMNLAQIKYETNQLDSALILIRDVPDSVRPFSRNDALAYASTIYLDNGILDTAYIYARELLHSPYPNNRGTAYETLLSPMLKNYVPIDSIYKYVPEYIALLVRKYDDNEIKMSAIQQGAYNYNRHVIERQAAEDKNTRLKMWLLALASSCFMLIAVVLYYKNKNQKMLIELHNVLERIDNLKQRINSVDKAESTSRDSVPGVGTHWPTNTVEGLREKLREELMDLYNQNESIEISNVISESGAYRNLQEYIMQKKAIHDDDPLWDELESVVISSSPGFMENLTVLTQSRLTSVDIHTALLIKCHVTPSQMCILLSRTKGAVVSRRDNLCLKIFGKRLGTKVIDGIIRLL